MLNIPNMDGGTPCAFLFLVQKFSKYLLLCRHACCECYTLISLSKMLTFKSFKGQQRPWCWRLNKWLLQYQSTIPNQRFGHADLSSPYETARQTRPTPLVIADKRDQTYYVLFPSEPGKVGYRIEMADTDSLYQTLSGVLVRIQSGEPVIQWYIIIRRHSESGGLLHPCKQK